MGFVVRCRGGEWLIERPKRAPAGFDVRAVLFRRHVRWNAVPSGNFAAWGAAPAWLPIAWLCGEADPDEGPPFAAAILDAPPGDDAPSLIACDWLERSGAQGFIEIDRVATELDPPFAPPTARQLSLWPMPEAAPEGWGPVEWLGEGGPPGVAMQGPLAAWCRHLIATRCPECGGRRDGEDVLREVLNDRADDFPTEIAPINISFRKRNSKRPSRNNPLCPRCEFPAGCSPPHLDIPNLAESP